VADHIDPDDDLDLGDLDPSLGLLHIEAYGHAGRALETCDMRLKGIPPEVALERLRADIRREYGSEEGRLQLRVIAMGIRDAEAGRGPRQ
jgi:hypothetical protein